MSKPSISKPTLADLEAFAVVAAERSFRRAADVIGVSRSALSHRMRHLEEQLGVLDLQSSVMDDVIMRMMQHRSDAGTGRLLQRPTCVARAGCSASD